MVASYRSLDSIVAGAIEEEWGRMIWMASREIGNAAQLSSGRMLMRPGGGNRLHSHPDCEEMILLLRGRVEHDIGGDVIAQSPGDLIVVQPGVPHRTRNTGPDQADIIICFSSADRGFRAEE